MDKKIKDITKQQNKLMDLEELEGEEYLKEILSVAAERTITK